jgi:hypothetical protein
MLRSANQLRTEESAFRPCAQDKGAIRRWVTAAQEKSLDADNVSVSIGTRFEAAYDAAFNIALAVINANGWRLRSVQGHHAFALEAACEAIGAGLTTFDKLDAIRELRNQKYDGVARTAFQTFSDVAVAWLQNQRPALFK